jgi:hypothetical protein
MLQLTFNTRRCVRKGPLADNLANGPMATPAPSAPGVF